MLHAHSFTRPVHAFAYGVYCKRAAAGRPASREVLRDPSVFTCTGEVVACGCGVKQFRPFNRRLLAVEADPFEC